MQSAGAALHKLLGKVKVVQDFGAGDLSGAGSESGPGRGNNLGQLTAILGPLVILLVGLIAVFYALFAGRVIYRTLKWASA